MSGDLFPRPHNYPPMLGPLEEWPAGSPEWAERLSLRIKLGVEKIAEQGIDRLIPWIELALTTEPHPWEVWPTDHPCLLPDKYFRYAAGVGCVDIAKLISAYRGEDYSLVRQLRGATAEGEAKTIRQGARTDLGEHRASGTKLGRGSNSAPHILRRLAVKHPGILAAYERGEFRSARAAGIAAGIVKPPSWEAQVLALWKRGTPEGRAAVYPKLRLKG